MKKTFRPMLSIVLLLACLGASVLGVILGFASTPSVCEAKELTLQDLLNGERIAIDDKLFGKFRNFESDGSGGASPVDPAQVAVIPKRDPFGPGLRFVGNFFGDPSEFHTDRDQTQRTTFEYVVSTISGQELITDNSLELTKFFTDPSGNIAITETVRDEFDNLLGEKSVFAGDIIQQLTAELHFAPQDQLVITKTISLSGLALVEEFRQDFSQVPEPSTWLLLASGFAIVVLARKKLDSAPAPALTENSTMQGHRFFTVFCLAGIFGAASSAWAVPTIAVDEASVEGFYTITCQDLGCQNTGMFPFTEVGTVHVVIPILPTLGAPLSGGVNLLDADGSLSDGVLVSGTAGGSIVFDFGSSNETGFPVLDPVSGPFLLETGQPQEVATGTLADGRELHITFASDVDSVPEPSTLLLLGSGLLALAFAKGSSRCSWNQCSPYLDLAAVMQVADWRKK